MKSAAFKDCIEDYVKEYPPNQPIYTTRVAEKLAEKYHLQKDRAKKLVNVNLKRLFDKNTVERFQKGIYYKTIPTPFGNTKLNPTHIVRDQYILKNGDIIGYETDASFLNRIGLTTQMPRYTYIATNLSNRGNERKEKLHIILRKPSTEVTKDNYLYLQILDAIENKNKISIDAKNPSRIYLSYILDCKLDSIKLIAFASKFYPKRVLEKFIEIAKSTI